MEVELNNLTPVQIQEIIARLQQLEVENNQLRNESRVPTPVVPVPQSDTHGSFMNPKLIPRPDKFDGSRKGNKVREFKRKIERYIRCQPTLEDRYHCDVVSGFLTGAADVWFTRWSKGKNSFTAAELLEDLVEHFSPANVSQEARRKLSKFEQRGPASDYSVKFRELLEEIDEISEEEAKNYFINGLQPQVKKEVLLKDLKDEFTLDETEQIAIQIDSILFKNRNPGRVFNANRQNNSAVTPMEGIQYNALSLEERTRLQKEDRCFSCKQQKSHAPGCRSRYVFRSNNLDVEQEEPSDDA
jgi:hypothetical protein